MTTLKHSSKGTIAVITETTVYLAMLDGTIIKHFPSAHFKDSSYIEEIEFPVDFETAKKEYSQRQALKNQERIESHNLMLAVQRETRKQDLINLWNWRKGRIEAYKIYTCDVPVETFGKNPSYYGSYSKLIFGKETAMEQFKETIGSWKPEFDNSPNNVQGEVCLYHFDIELAERIEITSVEELSEVSIDFEPIEDEWFSVEIPHKALIVGLDEHRGSFNRKYYTVNQVQVKGDYTGGYTIGYRKMDNYSDLWGQVVFDSINDYIEQYQSDEDAMKKLMDTFSLENAKGYGLDEAYFELFEK